MSACNTFPLQSRYVQLAYALLIPLRITVRDRKHLIN